MSIAPKAGSTILIVANTNLVDASGNLIQDNITHVSQILAKGCKVILAMHVVSDADEEKMRTNLTKALPSLPPKSIIFFENINSIYSICRQLEPKYVVDAYEESYKLTARFFSGCYFKTDASNFKATITL